MVVERGLIVRTSARRRPQSGFLLQGRSAPPLHPVAGRLYRHAAMEAFAELLPNGRQPAVKICYEVYRRVVRDDLSAPDRRR
jgi:hypothetical protein